MSRAVEMREGIQDRFVRDGLDGLWQTFILLEKQFWAKWHNPQHMKWS